MIAATYNVNSINARMENLACWLREKSPDIVLLQEIKTEYDGFPFFELQALGYEAAILGQKSYNGVAVLSKKKIKVIEEGLPGLKDEQARYLEVETEAGGEVWRAASVYLPNGNPPYNHPDDDSKYVYKLKWMDALYEHAKDLLQLNRPVLLGGDFNVILTAEDVYDEKAFLNNALCREEVRQKLTAIRYLGFYDAFRLLHPQEKGYTFWDYAGQAFPADNGMRIDYMMLSPQAADRLLFCEVDKDPRRGIKPSDHTPLMVELKS